MVGRCQEVPAAEVLPRQIPTIHKKTLVVEYITLLYYYTVVDGTVGRHYVVLVQDMYTLLYSGTHAVLVQGDGMGGAWA